MSISSTVENLIFRPKARLIRLLGENLLSDEVIALVELVKNAHDADASLVEIRLENITSRTKGKMTVTDNGHGMTLEQIKGPWMEIGTDIKKREKVTSKGRRVLGEKGIGRLAADKIAKKLELISKSEESNKEIYAVFDWTKYDEDIYLEEVHNPIIEREPIEIKKHGTKLILTGLRTKWNKRMVDKLFTTLVRLISPFYPVENFNIKFYSNEFPHIESEIRKDVFNLAPYKIKAKIGRNGKINYIRNNENNKIIDFIKDDEKGLPSCGPFELELYAWDLSSQRLKRLGMSVARARTLIRAWSGVNIYRDSFRVFPYGEEGEDWLELDRRRIAEMSTRFSRNQILGFVNISGDNNPELIDQTNRQGLIQNEAYYDLKRGVIIALQQLENIRIEEREKLKKEQKQVIISSTPTEMLDDLLDTVSNLPKDNIQVEGIIKSIVEVKDIVERTEEETYEIRSRYHRNVTISQLAANIIHEIKQPSTTIILESKNGLIALSRKIINKVFINKSFEILKDRGYFLNKIVDKWSPFIRTNKKVEKININEIIASAFEFYNSEIEEHGISIEYPDPEKEITVVEIDFADATMIFGNLIRNSIYWLSVDQTTDPTIKVTVREVGSNSIITFMDNGPGVEPDFYDKIFLPGWTTREDGSGLGLSIIGEILDDYDGQISVASLAEGEKGIIFILEMPCIEGGNSDE